MTLGQRSWIVAGKVHYFPSAVSVEQTNKNKKRMVVSINSKATIKLWWTQEN